MSKLSHFNEAGDARMVDVGSKPSSKRVAVAEGFISMNDSTLRMVLEGRHAKGDVLGVARVAAIMAAKRTSDLVPLCHPLNLSHMEVGFSAADGSIRCEATAHANGATGVEMEALAAVQVGLLTVYDMCKAVQRGMVISGVRLLRKEGGKSGLWEAEDL